MFGTVLILLIRAVTDTAVWGEYTSNTSDVYGTSYRFRINSNVKVSTGVFQSIGAAVTMDPVMAAFCSSKDSIVCGSVVYAVCGSDGILYTNRCEFSKRRCDDISLRAMPADTCGVTTTTTPSPTTMTQPPSQTMDPLFAVFCRSAGSISCSDDFSPICGSDGAFYLNKCEYSKSTCRDPTLTVEPISHCTGS